MLDPVGCDLSIWLAATRSGCDPVKLMVPVLTLQRLTRAQHARARGAGSGAAQHLLVTPRGRAGSYVDNYLASCGLRRRIDLELSSFLPVGEVVASSDSIAALPRPLAARLAQGDRRLRTFALPFPSPRFVARMVWAERVDQDPAQAWSRHRLAAVAAALPALDA